MDIIATVTGKKGEERLHLDMPFDPKGHLSASGKNNVLASTGGNIDIAGDGVPTGLKLGLNAYFPNH